MSLWGKIIVKYYLSQSRRIQLTRVTSIILWTSYSESSVIISLENDSESKVEMRLWYWLLDWLDRSLGGRQSKTT